MHWQYAPVVWIYITSTVLAGWMSVYAWRRRAIPGAAAFALMQAGAALWSAGYALLISRSDLPSIVFLANVAWTGAVIQVPACLVLSLQFINPVKPSRRVLIWQSIFPAMTLVVVWTSNFHKLLRQEIHLRTVGSLRFPAPIPGVWYWLYFFYGYGLVLTAMGILAVAAWRSPRGRRGQPVTL